MRRQGGPGRWLPVAGRRNEIFPCDLCSGGRGSGGGAPRVLRGLGRSPRPRRGAAKPGLIDLLGGQAADRDDRRAARPGNGGHSPPRVSSTMAIRASGVWNPYAILVSRRIWVLVASLRALLKP